jgi:ABC-type polysaccharide/polyol phosphate export permease
MKIISMVSLSLNNDILRTLQYTSRICRIAFLYNSASYRRTLLGPLWSILAVAFGSFGIAILWSFIFKMEFSTAIPHITTGFLVWYFISGAIIQGSNCFTSQSPTFLSIKIPLSFYPLISLTKDSFTFIQSLLVVLVINLVFPPENPFNILLFIPYFVMAFINLFLMMYLIGFLNARFRDIGVFISSIMPMLFFLSPVIFKASHLGDDIQWIIYANPLSSFVVCLRDPLIGINPNLFFVMEQLVMMLVQFILLSYLYSKKHKNLCFWL